MSGTMDSVAAVNSVVRTTLALVVLGGIGMAAWRWHSDRTAKERAVADSARQLARAEGELDEARSELNRALQQLDQRRAELEHKERELAEQAQRIERLETSMRLLKVDKRVARLSVVRQDTDPDTREMETVVEFVELGEDGQPADLPRRFTIQGDVVYVDNLVVKFDDAYVERADLERSTSLVMFRRIFGERQTPQDGFSIDPEGRQPAVYATGKGTELERKIWADFWSIANDPARAAELGIRAAHGQAVSIKAQPNKSYRIELRASDGLTIAPEPRDS